LAGELSKLKENYVPKSQKSGLKSFVKSWEV